jgi:hypothetical protein
MNAGIFQQGQPLAEKKQGAWEKIAKTSGQTFENWNSLE